MRMLMYHQVIEGKPGELHAVSAHQFGEQMRWLQERGCRATYAEDIFSIEDRASRADPSPSVVLTFDDGYLDFLTTALPILREYGYVATVFLVAGFVGKARPWEGTGDESPPLLMNWPQVRELLSCGIRIGSHTMTHPDLTTLSADQVVEELRNSRAAIEDRLGIPITGFCYPYGRENPLVRRLVRESGYAWACASRPHYIGGPGRDPYRLQRLTMLATDTPDGFAAKMRGNPRQRWRWYNWLFRHSLRQQTSRLAAMVRR